MAKDPYKYFRVEAHDLVDQLGKGLLGLDREGSAAALVPGLLRLAHTLKGAARVVRQPEIADYAHAIEDALSPFRSAQSGVPRELVNAALALVDSIAKGVGALTPAEDVAALAANKPATPEEGFRTVRAEVGEIDALLDGVTECATQLASLRAASGALEHARHLADVLTDQLALRAPRAALQSGFGHGDRAYAIAEELRGICASLERSLGSAHELMDRELRQLRDAGEQLRLVPAGGLFNTLERTARDIAQSIGTQVIFEGKGGEVRLDAHVLRVVQEALLQIIRNAVAHGIEPERERRPLGKPAAGRVSVEVSRRGRRVVFKCSDDGRGVDVEAVRRAAHQRGLSAAETERLGAQDLLQLMLRGGLSTSLAVTEVAGRGIGMDIVRESAERLGGEVTVRTAVGAGTTFELVVPLSLASLEALVVESAGISATVPLDAVRHTLRVPARDVFKTSLGDAIVYDGHATPFISLARLLKADVPAPRSRADWSVVILAGVEGAAALGIDSLRGTANIVFRSLPDLAAADAIVAGASLDAAGNPQLVLDADALVAEAFHQGASAPEERPPQKSVLVIDDSLTTRMLEQSILESAGYQVDVATSAEEGLERARRARYGLFLVDVEMPGMDGFAFIKRIRDEPKLCDIPAILVTSRASPEDRRHGEEVGANDYIVKSEFDQAALLRRIRQLAV